MSCLECKKCPVSTEPVYGHHLTWWHSVPENLRATCFSMSGVWHFRLVYMMVKLSYKCVVVCWKMFNNVFKFLSVHLAIFAQKILLWLMFAVKFCENFKSWNDVVKLLLCAGKFNLVWVVGCWLLGGSWGEEWVMAVFYWLVCTYFIKQLLVSFFRSWMHHKAGLAASWKLPWQWYQSSRWCLHDTETSCRRLWKSWGS